MAAPVRYSDLTSFADYYNISGNASIHDADVICFASITSDSDDMDTNKTYNVNLINTIWKDHQVLVDKFSLETQEVAFLHPMTIGITVTEFVKGWDADDYIPRHEELDSKKDGIETAFERIKTEMTAGKFIEFLSPGSALDSFLKCLPRTQREYLEAARVILINKNNECLDADSKNQHRLLMEFHAEIRLFINKLQEVKTKCIASFQKEAADLNNELFPSRQLSLIEAIKINLTTSGKVMVLASSNFFISPIGCREENRVLHFLKMNKFVVLTPKKQAFLPTNPILWGSSCSPSLICEGMVRQDLSATGPAAPICAPCHDHS